MAEVATQIEQLAQPEIRDQVLVLAASWLVAFLSGLSRTSSDGRYQSWRHLCSLGASAGFLGLASVGMCSGIRGDLVDSWVLYVGVSAVIGLLGKEQDRFIRSLTGKVLKMVGAEELPSDNACPLPHQENPIVPVDRLPNAP